MKKLLSLAGGGSRGILQARILAHFEAATGLRVCDCFSLIAGTSTGGLLACCAAIGMPMKDAVNLYVNECPVIFKKRWWRMQGALIPRYPASNIEPVLKKYFGSKQLSDTLCDIMVTSYDYEAKRALFMTSREWRPGNPLTKPGATKGVKTGSNAELWRVCRRTSAAPTYFPAAEGRYQDGGLVCNDPSREAIVEELSWGASLSDIHLLSLGTGDAATAKDQGLGLQGALSLLPHIGDEFMQPGADAVEYECRHLLGDRYSRVQPQLGNVSAAMDLSSLEHMLALIALADIAVSRLPAGFWDKWAS